MKSRHSLLIGFMGCTVWVLMGTSGAGQQPDGQRSACPPEVTPVSYEDWIAPYRKGPLGGALGDRHAIEMTLTIIKGDDLKPDEKSASVLGCGYRTMVTTFAVSNEGTESMSRWTSGAIQGGGPDNLLREDFERLKNLTANLPDDHERIPPPGRRLVVRVVERDGVEARVYDQANLPDKILEILRLVGGDTWPIVDYPRFEPNVHWKKDQIEESGIPKDALGFRFTDERMLAVDPSGSLKAVEINPCQCFDSTVHVANLKKPHEAPFSRNMFTTLRIENARDGSMVHEIREPMNGRTWNYLYRGWFTPDGRYLLVLSSVPEIRIYDVATWQRVDRIPGVPTEAVAYYPSADWTHGVAVLPDGEINLIESNTGRTLARIGNSDELQTVVWSPDASMAAVVTVGKDSAGGYLSHMRLWRTANGTLAHKLWPLEETSRDGFGEPAWWPDGKFLLAPTREGHFGGPNIVGIWNVEAGRYRGTLAGCMYPDTPWSQFLLQGAKFYKTCENGEILMWNVQEDLRKITDFEAALAK